MVLKNLLARVGVGNAQVDTHVINPVLIPGQAMRGVVTLQGGSVPQHIDRIELVLETVAEHESGDQESLHQATILVESLTQNIQLESGVRKEIPFSLQVPFDAPLTQVFGIDLRIPVYLRTRIHVAGAIDPSDRDRVVIKPHPAQERILTAMENLGFRLFNSDLEFGTIPGARLPFYQELEYKAGSSFARHMNELELTFVARARDMDVIIEMDKKTRGLARLAYSSIDEVRGFNVNYADFPHQDWETRIERLLLR